MRAHSLILDQFVRTPASLLSASSARRLVPRAASATKTAIPPTTTTPTTASSPALSPISTAAQPFTNMSQNPGLVSSHAEYVKGVAEETIGSVTGSQEWQTAGDKLKADAVADMRKAAEARNPESSGFGKAEELAGKAVGCEGMQEEGAASEAAKNKTA